MRVPVAEHSIRSLRVPLVALAVAVVVRVPHYDVAWFGVDPVTFMAQGRRILDGHWDVTGPLASGLNIVGPLYSYLLAALLWIRDEPAFVTNVTVWFGVLATLFLYDAARRMTSEGPALIAAVSYAVAPALVEGTRLVWNPSLLPPMLVLGWWAVVRYVQAPSMVRIAGCGLVAGFLIPLHLTGVFGVIGMATAVTLGRPRLTHALAGVAAALVPMTPGLLRLTRATGDGVALVQGLGGDWPSTFEAVAITSVRLPAAVWLGEQPWSVWGAVFSLHVQAAAAIVGAILGLRLRGRFGSIWLGVTLSLLLHIMSTRLYGRTLSWYYFIAVIPPICLLLAPFAAAVRPRAIAAAALMLWMGGIVSQATFICQFDRRAIDSGLITADLGRLGVRLPRAIAQSIPVRELRVTGEALHRFVRDGATALATVHGGRGELWRQAGAEFLPAASAADLLSPWQFIMMGPGVEPIDRQARVLPGRVCASMAVPMEWRMHHPPIVPGWENPAFDDSTWHAISVPRRLPRASPGGSSPVSPWERADVLIRGRVIFHGRRIPHLVGVTIHGVPIAGRSLQAFINGRQVPTAHRVVNSEVASTDEWLLDVTDTITAGPNTIALFIDGVIRHFDLDVFDVPCIDAEWYRPLH
jgi:Dolichyl-phosphate-mannose-protein mannosyltransferase